MFDPEEDVAPGDTTSQDASKPGFQSAWNKWTSRPENNAALLQFGISMLQPRAPGQSVIGAAANSIGNAGEAVGRVNAQTRADEAQASTEEDKAAQRENQKTVAESGRITANAYGRSVDNSIANPKVGTSGALRVQQDFRKWLAKPDDQTGLTTDPVVGAIQKQFPNVKTKADLLNDPAARAAAFRLFSQQMTTEPTDDGTLDSGSGGGSPAPVPPVPGTARTIYDSKGKPFTWDGVPGHPPVAQ